MFENIIFFKQRCAQSLVRGGVFWRLLFLFIFCVERGLNVRLLGSAPISDHWGAVILLFLICIKFHDLLDCIYNICSWVVGRPFLMDRLIIKLLLGRIIRVLPRSCHWDLVMVVRVVAWYRMVLDQVWADRIIRLGLERRARPLLESFKWLLQNLILVLILFIFFTLWQGFVS